MNRIFIGLLALTLGCGDDSKVDTIPQNNAQQSNNASNNENNNVSNNNSNGVTNNGDTLVNNFTTAPTQPQIGVQGVVDFGEVAAGASKTMAIEIGNSGTELTISDIQLEGLDFEMEAPEFPVVIAQGQRFVLDVHLKPSVSTERLGTLRVMSDTPNAPMSETRLVANELCGVVDPVTTLLDNTVVGETYNSTITLTNCSEIVEIHVTEFEHARGGSPAYFNDFKFPEIAAPFVLLPGEVFSFDVTFEPRTAGEHAADFLFSTTGTLGINRSELRGRLGARNVTE